MGCKGNLLPCGETTAKLTPEFVMLQLFCIFLYCAFIVVESVDFPWEPLPNGKNACGEACVGGREGRTGGMICGWNVK